MKKPQDTSYLDDALPAFISEAQEQYETFEQLMLELEVNPDDRDMLDALFRCAHTVKGSAGVFGLDAVVAFTHHVETLLDLVRDGRKKLTPALSTLLLESNDQIRKLVSLPPGTQLAGEAATLQQELVRQLKSACNLGVATEAAAENPTGATASLVTPVTGPQTWKLGARFGAETFRNGMDPLAIIQYVAELGVLGEAAIEPAAVPMLKALEPETCHLVFGCTLLTEAARSDIESAFVFVRDDCELTLACLAEPQPEQPAVAATGEAATVPAPLAPSQSQVLAPEADSAAKKTPVAREGTATNGEDGRFIRVQASRLDAVINLLGELVIASAGASQLAQDSRQRRLVEANLQISHLVEEIRNGTLQLRMVPIGETFARFRRVVRDTASELGKDVHLELVGGETELDKSVVERIADPLMHLVRNALDHGLEKPADREASGKPAQGRITLAASHESGGILITIADDGRGIQRDKVLQRAWERGLLPRGTTPADAEILQLIFEPGFSTAEKVTNLSGRGVGMDVVRRNIEALRGTVTLHSEPGAGSRIEIRLPLTLAIIDGFLVGVGNSRFIFPLETVIEVIDSREPDHVDALGRSVMELRGQPLPVVDLRRLYGMDEPEPTQTSVVVIRHQESRYGVLVDRLLGQHQTVIKPLGKLFRSLRGISGSSILGNGDVALIFDVPALGVLSASAGGTSRTAAALAVTSLQSSATNV
ncbi:chemotaxis protein CheA [soil metagenome]